MRCSNSNCGWQGNGNFCQSCGCKMIEVPAEFIKCNGTFEGKLCGANLRKTQNFCTKCGKRIDKSLFSYLSEICNGCGTVLEQECLFCAECGMRKGATKGNKTEEETVKGTDKDHPFVERNNILLPSNGKECSIVAIIGDSFQRNPPLNEDETTRSQNVCMQKESRQHGVDTIGHAISKPILQDTDSDDADVSNENKTRKKLNTMKEGNRTKIKPEKCTVKSISTVESNKVQTQRNNEECSTVDEINNKLEDESLRYRNDGEIMGSQNGTLNRQNGNDVPKRESNTFNATCLGFTSNDSEKSKDIRAAILSGVTDDRKEGITGFEENQLKGESATSKFEGELSFNRIINISQGQNTELSSCTSTREITELRQHSKSELINTTISETVIEQTENIQPNAETDAGAVMCHIDLTLRGREKNTNKTTCTQNVDNTDYMEQKNKREEILHTEASQVSPRSEYSLPQPLTSPLSDEDEYDTQYDSDSDSEKESDERSAEPVEEDNSKSDETSLTGSKQTETSHNHSHKRKGGSKARRIRKRERKSKVHSERYKRKKDKNEKTNIEQFDVIENQTKVANDNKCEGRAIEDDGVLENSVSEKGFIFGNGKTCNRKEGITEDQQIIFPPDPTSPSFFQSTKIFSGDDKSSNDISSKTILETEPKKIPIHSIQEKEACLPENDNKHFGETNNSMEPRKMKEEEKIEKNEKNDKEKKQTEKDGHSHVARLKNGTRSNDTSGPDWITVVFHVLVPQKLVKRNRRVLFLSSLYGWEKSPLDLQVVGGNAAYQERMVTIKVPSYMVLFGNYIWYKYAVSEYMGYLEWEDYFNQINNDINKNRRLGIDKRLLADTDLWHQYDGCLTLKSDQNFVQMGLNILLGRDEHDRLIQASNFASYFCPAWFRLNFNLTDTTNTPKESVQQLVYLYNGLRRVYNVDYRLYSSEEEFGKQFVAWILSPMVDSISRRDSTFNGIHIRVLRAICIVVFCGEVNLQLNETVWQRTCRSLVVNGDVHTKTCKELKDIKEFFPEQRTLVKHLQKFIEKVKHFGKNPSWLYAIPLLHFLECLCNPFDEPTSEHNHTDQLPKWWGIAEIKSTIDVFKKNDHKWKISLKDVLKTLQPLFDVDFYLPRTIMACLRPFELREIIGDKIMPVEVCCAALCYYIKNTTCSTSLGSRSVSDVKGEEKTVIECIEKLMKRLQCFNLNEERSEIRWLLAFSIAFDAVTETRCTNKTLKVMFSSHIFLHCASIYKNICQYFGNENKKIQNIDKKCTEVNSQVTNWLLVYENDSWSTRLADHMKVWNYAFVEGLQNEGIQLCWNADISKILTERVQTQFKIQKDVTSAFIQIYCKGKDAYSRPMQDCLDEIALKAIGNGIDLDLKSFEDTNKRQFATLLSEMFAREWRTVKGGKDKKDHILTMVLKWSPFKQLIKILYKKEMCGISLPEDCRTNLQDAVTILRSQAEEILEGNITVGTLRIIQKNESTFCDILQEISIKDEPSSTLLRKVIHIRVKEVDAFERQADQMKTLVDLCSHCPSVCVNEIQTVLQKQVEIEQFPVSEFCNTRAIDLETNTNSYYPEICAFDISDNVYEILAELRKYKASFVFNKLWTDGCSAVNDEILTVDELVRKLWLPIKERLDTFSKDLKSGDIEFQTFEKYIGSVYDDDYDGMFEELLKLGLNDRSSRTRLEQLKQFRKLGSCVHGARVIIQLMKTYELQGDFQPVEAIAHRNRTDFSMKSFDKNLIQTCSFLEEITPARAKCLSAYVNCDNLVKWLNETMRELKELKVFVDLALISAGDDPLLMDKVEYLHTAVTGYAPLIFELKSESDYKDLLEHCQIVWKELEANSNLPHMLIDTNKELEWLKDVVKAHGSVEVTSFMQVEAINSCGVYTVGRMTGENIFKLTVREESGKRQRREYTLDQLQDLTSRLMLVAGNTEKRNVNVENFHMTLDGMIRLYNVYNKLCSSGCVLFHNWSVTCFCENRKPVALMLQFGQGEDIPAIKGFRSKTEDLKDLIPEIAKFMENCLMQWLQHIKDKRKEYIHLNYFTVDQLVILQTELVKVGTDQLPSNLVYPLLSAVKQNCLHDDLVEAMVNAKEEFADGTLQNTYENGTAKEICGQHSQIEDEMRIKFVNELEKAGFDVELATKALDHLDPEDISGGIIWCMANEDASEEITISCSENADGRLSNFSGLSQTDITLSTMINSSVSGLTNRSDEGSRPLLNKLLTLWDQFLQSVTSSIQDYISIEQLGVILKHLATKDSRLIERSLPPSFSVGEPNLLLCPSADMVVTTLSMYMRDRNQPFPQSDEILMCTDRTTKDEVDIFWRRAIFGGTRKLYCLMNADVLSYDASEAAERCLDEYLKETHFANDLKYQLIVICGSDNEYRSTIVSSLDKFKKQPLPINKALACEYLASKLRTVEDHYERITPAACIDSERTTVRLIKSCRAGVGKTLFKIRQEEKLMALNKQKNVRRDVVTIPLHEKTIDIHQVIQKLLVYTQKPSEMTARLFHIDIAHEVEHGVDYLLFNLCILECLTDMTGYVWRKSPSDIYLIENMPLLVETTNKRGKEWQFVHEMLSILPDMTCRSPKESLNIYKRIGIRPYGFKDLDQLFDVKQFRCPVFQRTFQYLFRFENNASFEDVQPSESEGTPEMCLEVLLRYCGIEDPSWSEIHYFVCFLNTQLESFEQNNFVGPAAAQHLPGFGSFLLRFLILMSRDFSTRSLNMSEESPAQKHVQEEELDIILGEDDEGNENGGNQADLEQYQMRRTWESSPHPYLFFNSDRETFTFLGFSIDKHTGNLVDQQTGRVLAEGVMQPNLYKGLIRNRAPLHENFDLLERHEKIIKLCKVMGIEMEHDPDETYELTADNVKKMLAIYMRFRCDIPVIIMGETGCGKTRLIKFLCALQMPPGVPQTNMILMKVHGGSTYDDIKREVAKAEKIAHDNTEQYGAHIYTVLFFDEANTTEAIGLIKEIMCDKRMDGKKLKLNENLKIIAACNPYRKHSEELIKKLEQAGLGYHVDADKTTDRLGRVPMRRLVYRVQPLPQSLLPLVWDFGQLDTQVEDLYIRQMVRRYIREELLPDVPRLTEVVSAILTASHFFMRDQKDECSFVSLRDVDRVLSMMSWFYIQSQGERTLYKLMDARFDGDGDKNEKLDDLTRSLILALGVCYHACLRKRKHYRRYVARYFQQPCALTNGDDQIKREIECCQDVFLDNVQLEKNIARNKALKENVFMMTVCIEQRIPLFLVGKPGSSKSLAKTIVADAMQGNSARKELFKELKQAQMLSFQCSPLSTPDGIVSTFKQCAQFQKEKNLQSFVSIVVLDEVGLAEDSPRMPLKTLHPLLEDGCQGDETPERYKKVAFIGISNWALDPAKMNRGILVQREVPKLDELKSSARGICKAEQGIGNLIQPFLEPMAKSYLEIFEKATKQMREFFGLRDFYSLVKMVFRFVEKGKRKPTWHEMMHAIMRNFGGLDGKNVDPLECFRRHFAAVDFGEQSERYPDSSTSGLVEACLFDTYDMNSESRYLLLLTENYGALSIVQQLIMSRSGRPITIFGSSFRSDQEYTQVCRNINKIKICMETGKTVVLLNLENLYESLYDALNQYYVYFGGARYVDLGLGTHRVKCRVHEQFRLIVIAEKQTVYKKFPIPLINRLEKHFLTISTILSNEQQDMVKDLENWTTQFIAQKSAYIGQRDRNLKVKVEDVFIGYHEDTCSSVVLHILERSKTWRNHPDFKEKVLKKCKTVLLWSATPDSVLRLKISDLPSTEAKMYMEIYFKEQAHQSLMHYLEQALLNNSSETQLLVQITTHSKLLSMTHKGQIGLSSGVKEDQILMIENVSSFDTEQQFSNKIRNHLKIVESGPSLIVVQHDTGNLNANLIACARYCVQDELERISEGSSSITHVVFIVQLPRSSRFPGFQCGAWQSVHIDDLLPEDFKMPAVEDMSGRSASSLLKEAVCDSKENGAEEYVEKKGLKERDCFEDQDEDNDDKLPEDSPGMLVSARERQSTQLLLDDGIIHGELGAEKSQRMKKTNLNIKALILSCVQAALSTVKDRHNTLNNNRETDRVTLILKLLDQQRGTKRTFLHGITLLIVNMLEAKEAETVFARNEDWIVFEASNIDSITKTGTLRRSCTRILENKVAPILASIIAFLDTNCNLDLMGSNQSFWIQDLWLAILHSPKGLNLKYTDLKLRESDEVIVKTSGYEGHIFSACLPFSWLLISQISEIMKVELNHSTEDEKGDNSRMESCLRVLKQHPLFTILDEVTHGNHDEEIINLYIKDFVHGVYNPGTVEEYLLVCETLAQLARKMANNSNESLILSLICVHMAHYELAQRLVFFREINSVYPECSSIIERKQKNPDHFMFKENDFTFPAVCMLIEMLTPQKSEIDQDQGRVNWLKKVYTYRPVVEKVISLQRHELEYSAASLSSLKRARELWSRVVVVKLFLEHICNTDNKNKITVKYCMPLWTTLGEETDMKQIQSFSKVERFLKSCNKGAIREYIGTEEKCSHCERMLEGPPITLPCSDVVCDGCFEDVKAVGKYKCTKCNQIVPPEFQFERRVVEGDVHDKLRDYQRRCNAFFMDVVSQLCLADNCASSPEVVNRLLGYVFFKTSGENIRTKDCTIFNTGIDPNPVFRSYLLQLLIRSNRCKDNICENLEAYIEHAKSFIDENPAEREHHCIELSLLIIQCLEDMFSEQANILNENEEVDYVVHSLRSAKHMIDGPNLSASKLYSIANARMGLAKAAKYIAHVVESGISITAVPAKIKRVIEAAQILYEETDAKWSRIFLVKYICRCYGVDIYRSLCRSKASLLRWIALKEMNIEKVVEVCDRYVVCGHAYVTIREAVTKVVLGEAVDPLIDVLSELQTAGVKIEPLLTLAVHRELTSSYLYPQNQRKLTEKVMTSFESLFAESQMLENKELLISIVENQMVPRYLRYVEGEDMFQQGLKCVILHFQSVFVNLNCDGTLLQPLWNLMSSPHLCRGWFLPSMPQDDLEDVKVALLAARNQIRGADQNPVFYRCPNGHPYVIGNCGRAVVRALCRECGSEIGGQRHVILTGNTKDNGIDRTETGHILGQAATRARDPKPERFMTPTSCAIVRCLLHITMYLGTKENVQGVQNLIKPDLEEDDVEQYLWRHMEIDVETLCKALNRSADDVLLLIHLVIDNIFKAEETYADVQLSSKEGRSKWEILFCTSFLQDILKNLDEALKINSQLIATDKRLGADPLLCLLYETDTQNENENSTELHNLPRVWRYRTTISLHQLRQEIDTSFSKENRVLKLFLEEEHRLRAIRYIPSILHLQRMLLSKYYKKIDKIEASNITFGMLAQEQVAGIETEALLQDFGHAWELVRNSLQNYLCPTELGGMTVSKEFCNLQINDKTPLSMLLPTERDIGLCSYALLDFLFRSQNAFLDRYMKLSNRNLSLISKVLPKDLTSAHLICFDPQRDLLPLLSANCHYSFELGKGTKIEYDLNGIERQLMDRFLFSKSRIDVGRYLMIDTMVYKTEVTDAAVFKKLEDKIPQMMLDSPVRAQICNDVKHLPELWQSLTNLDIAISFLKTTGGHPEHNLHSFMKETLQMESSIPSRKAQQECEFRHLKSLWLLLSLQKAKKMTDSDKGSMSIFENVPPEFHEDISEDMLTIFSNYTQSLSVERLADLVEAMHEFILLVVAVKQNMDDSDSMHTTENKISEWLFGYMESLESPCVDLEVIADFPDELLFKHSVKLWMTTYNHLKRKLMPSNERF